NLRAGYNQPVGDTLKITADAMLSFSAKYDVIGDKDPNTRQGAWQKVDLRLGVGDIDDKWSLAVVGKNVFNEKLYGSANDIVASAGSYVAQIMRGRSVSVQGRVKF